MGFVSSKDSDQPRHPLSLIRVLAVLLWVANDFICLCADSEDSNETGPMHRLILVFSGCKAEK